MDDATGCSGDVRVDVAEYQKQLCLDLGKPRERTGVWIRSKVPVVQARWICTHRCAASGIQCGSKREVATDAEANGARRQTRGILFDVVARFEVIEHRARW